MSQASDNQTNGENLTDTTKKHHQPPQKGRLWALYTDSDDTDSSMDVPRIQRFDSQQSSISFRSDLSKSSDSELSDVTSRKRQRCFSVYLTTSQGDFAITVNASDIMMFIKKVKKKFHSKCQERSIDCLLLEINKDKYITLEEGTVEFSFLRSLRLVTVKVDSSPIIQKTVPVERTEVQNLGKQRDIKS